MTTPRDQREANQHPAKPPQFDSSLPSTRPEIEAAMKTLLEQLAIEAPVGVQHETMSQLGVLGRQLLLLAHQRQLFRVVLQRDPGLDDPMFWDPERESEGPVPRESAAFRRTLRQVVASLSPGAVPMEAAVLQRTLAQAVAYLSPHAGKGVEDPDVHDDEGDDDPEPTPNANTAAKPKDDSRTLLTVMPESFRGVLEAFLTTLSAENPQHDYAVLFAALCQPPNITTILYSDARKQTNQGIWELLTLPATMAALGTPAPEEQLLQLAHCYAALFAMLYRDLDGVAMVRKRGRSKRAREMCQVIHTLVDLPTVRMALSAASVGRRPIPSPAVLSVLHEQVSVAAGFGEHGWMVILCPAIAELFERNDAGPAFASLNLSASDTLLKTMRTQWCRLGVTLAAGQSREAYACFAGVNLALHLCKPDLAGEEWADLQRHIFTQDVVAANAKYMVLDKVLR